MKTAMTPSAFGPREVDARHTRVRVRAADEDHRRASRRRHVVDVRAAPREERLVLAALDRRADVRSLVLGRAHDALPIAVAASAPRRRCCGSRCNGRGCPRGPRGSRARSSPRRARSARRRPSPCPACSSRTGAHGGRGTPAGRDGARRSSRAPRWWSSRRRRPGRRAGCTTSRTRRRRGRCTRRTTTCRTRRSSPSTRAARGGRRRAARAARARARAASRSRSAKRLARGGLLRRGEPRNEPNASTLGAADARGSSRLARDGDPRDPRGRAGPLGRGDAAGARRDRHGRGVPRLEATGARDRLAPRVRRRTGRRRRDRDRRLALARRRRPRGDPRRADARGARGRLGAARDALGLGARPRVRRAHGPRQGGRRRLARVGARRGFVEVGRNSVLALDLTRPQAGGRPPDGIEIVTGPSGRSQAGMYEVAKEAYPDVPGEEDAEMEPFEQWLSMDMQGAGDRPEATFVALADDAVVAYAKLSLSRARPTVAMHDITGVKRAWRGRGIAGALKAAEIAWAKRERLRAPRDPERGAERADPPPKPAPRVRRRAGLGHGARPDAGLRARSGARARRRDGTRALISSAWWEGKTSAADRSNSGQRTNPTRS